MSLIDDELGGTTPMDVIIDAPKNEFAGEEFFVVKDEKKASIKSGTTVGPG